MPYKAKAIANYILDRADKADLPITPMQITKLVYLAHGWFLGFYKKPLISDDVQAWRFGPVIPAVYHEFKRYGADPIPSSARAEEFNIDKGYFNKCSAKIDDEGTGVIDRVVDAYGELTGFHLSNITHKDGTPWEQVHNDRSRGIIITNSVIQKHYADVISGSSTEPTP